MKINLSKQKLSNKLVYMGNQKRKAAPGLYRKSVTFVSFRNITLKITSQYLCKKIETTINPPTLTPVKFK